MRDSCGKSLCEPENIPIHLPLCKLAKATSCSSGLSKAPGQGFYFFLGAYTLIMLSALSFHKVEKPSAGKDETPALAAHT